MCLLALPSSQLDTMDAKRRVHRVSCADESTGEQLAIMSALPSPDRQGWSKKVSLELRYGTCAWCLLMATKTSVIAESDLLMACHKFSKVSALVYLLRRVTRKSTFENVGLGLLETLAFQTFSKVSALVHLLCKITM